MSGLVLKLGPKERVLVNGAVIENGDRRARISILTPGANILRLKDAIHPEEATTPVRRVCYIAQLVLSGDADAEEARLQLLRGIEQLSQVFLDEDSRTQLAAATRAVNDGQPYQALKALRALLPREERLLAAAPAPTGGPGGPRSSALAPAAPRQAMGRAQ
jgi:flagellar protein FlbT